MALGHNIAAVYKFHTRASVSVEKLRRTEDGIVLYKTSDIQSHSFKTITHSLLPRCLLLLSADSNNNKKSNGNDAKFDTVFIHLILVLSNLS